MSGATNSTSTQPSFSQALPPVPGPLPLEGGDRLTRIEFHRRYEAMPQVKKAELIEGVVYMPSPVARNHATPHARLIGWLSTYEAHTPGVEIGDNATVLLDEDNEPQPDALLRILPEHGGQSANTAEGDYIQGSPELVAEIASSSASYDLHDKKTAYRRNRVREYVVWRVRQRALDWFVLREGRYEPLAPATDGIVRSETFPGLWLAVDALLQNDMARVLDVVQEGVASEEHQLFAQRLKERPHSVS
jgi:Uma2 family endonuclease